MDINGLLSRLERVGAMRWMPTKMFLKYKYRRVTGKKLDLKDPKTFNEKLQWLKVYDRNPEYTRMVDKYEAKKYVAEIIGEEYIIPTLGVWDKFSEIDFDALPNQFVIKCTHDSGGVVICRDKSKLDIKKAKRKIEKSLRRNYYWYGREWPYKYVPPRIIAEEYIEDTETGDLSDYKLMCFNGRVRSTFVCTRRHAQEGLHVTFYDENWNVLPFTRNHPKEDTPIKQPGTYTRMVSLAETLSYNTTFLRVDFYEAGGRLMFGELTFYPGGGFEAFQPNEGDKFLGDWIDLSSIKKQD